MVTLMRQRVLQGKCIGPTIEGMVRLRGQSSKQVMVMFVSPRMDGF